jgi:hypothetical protein
MAVILYFLAGFLSDKVDRLQTPVTAMLGTCRRNISGLEASGHMSSDIPIDLAHGCALHRPFPSGSPISAGGSSCLHEASSARCWTSPCTSSVYDQCMGGSETRVPWAVLRLVCTEIVLFLIFGFSASTQGVGTLILEGFLMYGMAEKKARCARNTEAAHITLSATAKIILGLGIYLSNMRN